MFTALQVASNCYYTLHLRLRRYGRDSGQTMPIGEVLKSNVAEVLEALCNVPAGGRGKRKMVDMFMDLPDRESWPEYYEASKCFIDYTVSLR